MHRNKYNSDNDAIEVKYRTVEDESNNTVYYSIGEVADQLHEETSTIRYWSNKYYNYLDVISCNTHRRFSELDIEKLKVIKNCKQRKMTHKQIEMALKTTEFNEEKILNKLSDNQADLVVQTIASAVITQLESKITEYNEVMISSICKYINNSISEQIDNKLTSIGQINESFNNNINSFKNDILEQNKLLIIKLLENQVELNNNISNKMETNNTNIINSIENMKNEICSMENNSKNNINDSLDKYFYEIKEEISEIKEKQDEIKTVYLSLEEVKEQDYKSKSWIEKLISKLK